MLNSISFRCSCLCEFYATKAVAFYKQVRQDHARIIVAAAIAETSYAIMARSRNRGMYMHSRGRGTDHHQYRCHSYLCVEPGGHVSGADRNFNVAAKVRLVVALSPVSGWPRLQPLDTMRPPCVPRAASIVLWNSAYPKGLAVLLARLARRVAEPPHRFGRSPASRTEASGCPSESPRSNGSPETLAYSSGTATQDRL